LPSEIINYLEKNNFDNLKMILFYYHGVYNQLVYENEKIEKEKIIEFCSNKFKEIWLHFGSCYSMMKIPTQFQNILVSGYSKDVDYVESTCLEFKMLSKVYNYLKNENWVEICLNFLKEIKENDKKENKFNFYYEKLNVSVQFEEIKNKTPNIVATGKYFS
jgi:hypothetical protein